MTETENSDPDTRERFEAALAACQAPGEAYAALQALARATVGARLFTVMEVSGDAMQGQRAHTSDPGAYPVSGIIPLRENDWYDIAIRQRRPFVANDADEIAAAFADHALIASLGCASALNLPITVDGTLRATVNLLDRSGHFDPARVALAGRVLTEPARAAIRAEDRLRQAPKGKR